MTNAMYVVPDNPAEPEAAALELIVRLPSQIIGRDWPPLDVLQSLAAWLQIERAFADLSWHDAKHAAVAIIADLVNHDEPARHLMRRADRAIDGSDGIRWDHPVAMSRAMSIGAMVMGL